MINGFQENSLFAGLNSGAVEFFYMQAGDVEIALSKEDNNGGNDKKKLTCCSENFHKGPVIAVDSCEKLLIFLSCGSDCMIKLWDIEMNMLAEITLDNTLSTACFLNRSGDILLAFKSDIYTLPVSKALHLSETDLDPCSIPATESLIFEDQPYDELLGSKTDYSKSLEMNSYLVPYKGFTFNEDFTSEMPKKKEKPDTRLPMAPSEIYCSPCDSEASLKIFDFILQPRTLNVEERDKAEMSKRMIITKDMKYLPGPKPAKPAHCEMPFFGVSPCSSLVLQQLETEAKEQNDLSITKSIHETPTGLQQPVNEETSSEIMSEPESVEFLVKKETSEPQLQIDTFPSGKRTEASPKTDKYTIPQIILFSRSSQKYMPKKPIRREVLSPRKLNIPKHAKLVAKGAMKSRERAHTSSKPSAKRASILKPEGKKALIPYRIENWTPIEVRPILRRKSFLRKQEDNESIYEKYIKRVAAWRRKEHERIQHVEEQRLVLSLTKSPCSRSHHCFTPYNSHQYQHLQSSEHLLGFDFTSLSEQLHISPYTVMDETTINLPRDFPYRLAWGTPTTSELDIKQYHPRMKVSKEGKSGILPISKSLRPTKSIPGKGKFILVSDPVPPPPVPTPTRLESRLLNARFPRLKDKIFHSLLSDMEESS